MAAASAQMKAREEEKLSKETPSVRSVYDGPQPHNEIFDSPYLLPIQVASSDNLLTDDKTCRTQRKFWRGVKKLHSLNFES